jgi:hypothetical protein
VHPHEGNCYVVLPNRRALTAADREAFLAEMTEREAAAQGRVAEVEQQRDEALRALELAHGALDTMLLTSHEEEIAQLRASRDRAVREAERLAEIAHARWVVADRLRGALAVAGARAERAERERDDARFELHKIRNQALAGINLECPSDVCTYLAVDLDDLAEHGHLCHPAPDAEAVSR